MLWLAIATLLSFGFGQLFKWSQRRGCYAPVVVTVNYVVVATLLLLYHHFFDEGLNVDFDVALVGGVMGCSFIVSMALMTWALEVADVAAILTAFRLAILMPVLASVILWGETVSPRQFVGMAMAMTALVLMTRRRGHGSGSGRGLLLVLLVFLTQGVSQVSLRWVHYAGLDAQRLHVLFATAATAGLLGCFLVLAGRRRPVSADVGMGAGIGVYNLLALAAVLTALSIVEGTAFFPIHGCAIVILDNVFAHFYWKERLGPLAIAGAFLGACSMLLVL